MHRDPQVVPSSYQIRGFDLARPRNRISWPDPHRQPM